MNIINKVFSNKTFILYKKSIISKLIVVFIGVLNSVLINRYLGVTLRGEYTTILNAANLVQLVLNLGIGSVYPAFKKRNVKNIKSIFANIIFIQFALYTSFILFLFLFSDINIRYVLIIALVTIIESQVLFIAIVEDVLVKNRINIITTILNTILLMAIFLIDVRSLNIMLAVVILNHIILTVAIILKFKIYPRAVEDISKDMVKEITTLGIQSMLMNLLMFCNYHLDILILKYMTNDYYMIGLYGTAVTLGNMLWIIPDAFKDILFNRTAKGDKAEEIILSILVNILICIIIIVGFVFLGKGFLSFMYGAEYVAAYPLVLILFVGTLPMVLYKLIHPIYISNGKPQVVVKILSVSVIINIIGNVITIPLWGAIGCAISSVFSYSICGIVFLIIFKKDFNLKFFSIIKNKIEKR